MIQTMSITVTLIFLENLEFKTFKFSVIVWRSKLKFKKPKIDSDLTLFYFNLEWQTETRKKGWPAEKWFEAEYKKNSKEKRRCMFIEGHVLH